jgi:phosphoribosylaminoimidazole-succinocarboxamide synthase
MGSVKDARILRAAEESKPGYGMFVFSDRYSVFDWGEMPDLINAKGQALCTMGLYFFDCLKKLGIRHHCIGVMSGADILSYGDLRQPENSFMFNVLRVIKPEIRDGDYNYSAYGNLKSNYLIPLEVIYRNTLPEGSSVFRRLADGSLSLSDIGLKETPKPGQVLERPIVEVSTKLESMDRYISWNEAREISNLSDSEIERIKEITLAINDLISREAGKAGLVNEDGKFEFGLDRDRNIVVVDIIGTPDECRFTRMGMPVSKEILRRYYRGTKWHSHLEAAKKIDAVHWKKMVTELPPRLPSETISLVSALYRACCNDITGRLWFQVPPLEEILDRIRRSGPIL